MSVIFGDSVIFADTEAFAVTVRIRLVQLVLGLAARLAIPVGESMVPLPVAPLKEKI